MQNDGLDQICRPILQLVQRYMNDDTSQSRYFAAPHICSRTGSVLSWIAAVTIVDALSARTNRLPMGTAVRLF